MKDINEAYHVVFCDMMINCSELFKGKYDERYEGSSEFMYGIQTVMEYIALKDSEEQYQKFSDMFVKNLLISKKKAKV